MKTISTNTRLYMADVTQDDVPKMRAGEIKKELESYGISTVSFVEKSELVAALEKARADGLKPKEAKTTTTSSGSSSSSSSSSSPKKKKKRQDDAPQKDERPREERIAEAMAECQEMKAGDLKKELQERGISTASFFEKSDFVKAAAEARVDSVDKEAEEGYAEYTDVEVLTDESSGPRQRRSESEEP
ncbi:MAG: hypothetical protein SGILL_009592, partial [Bacillariaceae sp.]